MSSSPRRSGPDRGEEQQSTPVSPATIPLLFLGLMVGFLSGYFLLWWGLAIVTAVCVGAFAMVMSGRSRDAATGAILGVVAGYGLVMLVALFRGVL